MTVHIHPIEQRTEEWHAWKAQHATASNAACIMGVAVFEPKTPRKLIEVMTGVRSIFVTDAMKHGSESEDTIKDHYEEATGLEGSPLVISNGYLGASMDWSHMENPFAPIDRSAEFKTPVKGSKSKLWAAKTVDDVPIHYRLQIQHQYMVSESEQIDLVIYATDIDQIKIIPIPPDPECQGALREKWDEFWHYYTQGITPPAQRGDVKDSDDPVLHTLIADFEHVQQEIKESKEREKELHDQITEFADVCSIRCNGHIIERIVRKGNVNWKELCADQQLHDSFVNRFRKPSTVYHKIRSA